MKLACSSSAFDRLLGRGDLTQIEWLDLCANQLHLDGIVFDAPHFPRTDGEYLAQLKKMAVDSGLTIAAVRSDEIFSGSPQDGTTAERWIDVAAELGAPILVTRAPSPDGIPALAWNASVAAVRAAAAYGKKRNVTLAIRNVAGTLCANASDLKRLAKEADSAWLRFAVDISALGNQGDVESLLEKSVIAWHETQSIDTFGADESHDVAALLRKLHGFRAFFTIDYGGESAENDVVPRLIAWLETMLAKESLAKAAF